MYATKTRTLYLRVAPGGSRQWVQRLTVGGKRHHLGLGPVDAVTYSAASKAAIVNLAKIYQGIDPVAERREANRQASIPTFEQAMAATFEASRSRWSSAKSANKWLGLLRNYAAPLMPKRVDRITPQHVLNCLMAAHGVAPDSARRTRQCIRTVLSFCESRGHISRNPAGEAIEGALPKRTKAARAHFEALPHEAVAGAFAGVAGHENRAASLALRFLTLTAVRGAEARGATWDEIDLQGKLWTIPASRSKTSTEHRVPLSGAALALLVEAKNLTDGSPLVFPSPYRKGGMVSRDLQMRMLRAAAGAPCTLHGLRASFRSWCADTSRDRELAEAALGHVTGGVEASYQRSDLIERRRTLMEAWANYVTGRQAKVSRIAA